MIYETLLMFEKTRLMKKIYERINHHIGEMAVVNHRPHQQQGLSHKSKPETTSSLRQYSSAGISP